MIYGGSMAANSATYSGLTNGDTASVVSGLQFSGTGAASSNVGTYAIVPWGAAAGNYAIAYNPGLLTINPAALTITANDASRAFAADNPPFGATYTGLVNADSSAVVNNLLLSTPATVASPAGNYAINASGATAANYAITFVNGNLTVAAPPVATVMVDGVSVPVSTNSGTVFRSRDYAVIEQNGTEELVPVVGDTVSGSSVGGLVNASLADTTSRVRFESGWASTSFDGTAPVDNASNEAARVPGWAKIRGDFSVLYNASVSVDRSQSDHDITHSSSFDPTP
jgi:hypothetical protein